MQAAELNSISLAARLAPRESGLDAELGAFRGQMGALYLFDDALTLGRRLLCRSHSALTHYLQQRHWQAITQPATGEQLRIWHACLRARSLACDATKVGDPFPSACLRLAYTTKSGKRKLLSGACGAEQVKALHLLGPDYRSTFSPTESSAVLEQARRAVRSACPRARPVSHD